MAAKPDTMTTTTLDPANKQKTNNNSKVGISAANDVPASGETVVASHKAKRSNKKRKNKKRKKAWEATAAAANTVAVAPASDIREDSTPIDTPASSGAATDVEGETKPKQDRDVAELNNRPASKPSDEVAHESMKETQRESPKLTKQSSNDPLVVNGEIGLRPSSAVANSRKFDFDWADDGMEESEGMCEVDPGECIIFRPCAW